MIKSTTRIESNPIVPKKSFKLNQSDLNFEFSVYFIIEFNIQNESISQLEFLVYWIFRLHFQCLVLPIALYLNIGSKMSLLSLLLLLLSISAFHKSGSVGERNKYRYILSQSYWLNCERVSVCARVCVCVHFV